MNSNLLRCVAVVIGVSFCGVAQAETNSYRAPSKWNNFNSLGVKFRTVSMPLATDKAAAAATAQAAKQAVEELPIPAFMPAQKPLTVMGENGPEPAPVPLAHPATAAPCPSCTPYQRALNLGGISPWFAGGELLWLALANDSANRRLVIADATSVPYLHSADVDPKSSLGFETHLGRYFGCGRYAFDVSYFHWNPSAETVTGIPPAAGDWRAAMPAWRDITVNPGAPDTVYNYFDGAAGFRAHRDMFFQGIEANWSIFGLMGARRVGVCSPSGPLARFFPSRGCGNYGGACGPMARPCSGRVQIQAIQGFRWFQLNDAFEFAANINGAAGYQPDDLYYNVDAENNMFGYQVGSRLTYCLNCRWNVGIGGMIGIYGNHARVHQRIGTATNLAYITAAGVDDIQTDYSDTSVAALGELDLGMGFRFNDAWSLRGGYRLLSACGVATAPGSYPSEYTSVASAGAVYADDCVILHGGYAGLELNW